MELWIRSQDRTCLMKIKRVDYDYTAGLHRILVDGYKVLVGIYETKERALEVLDDLQKCLSSEFEFTGTYEKVDALIKTKMLNGLYGVIYNMPKE